jgi:hypothetical protein
MTPITRSPNGFEALLLGGLLALVPFEPRRPALPLGPFTLTVLEMAVLAVTAVLLWRGRAEVRGALSRGPVRWLALLAAAHLLAAAFAVAHRGLALKFALRVCLAAAFAAAVACRPPREVAQALRGLVAGAVLVAALAVTEGVGVRSIDPFLDLFREHPFNVGGSRRATAASEYPNQAGALLMYGAVALGGLAAAARPGPGLVAVASVLTAGLLFTYSRTALVAAMAGLAVVAAGYRRRGAGVCLAVLIAGTLVFTGAEQAFALRLSTQGLDSWYGAEYTPEATSLRLRPGERVTTTVRVGNRGRLTWVHDGQFHLSHHWYGVERKDLTDGTRARLPHDLGPGESVVLQAEIQAPAREGQYLLLWDMVQEHTSWFSGQGVAPGVVQVWVGSRTGAMDPVVPPAVLPSEPLVWRPGRRVLWPLALRMWRAHPWTGVGSDNYRWVYGAWAGRPSWDTRVFANNAYLEVAATTGTVGLVALLGTLVASARAAWRAHPPGEPLAAAVLGLLAALAVHGLADYVFAFTGHYVVFALVVGGAAALGAPARTGS